MFCSRRGFKILGIRIRWRLVVVIAVIIATGLATYVSLTRSYNKRIAEMQRLDAQLVELKRDLTKNPMGWIQTEREREFVERKHLFYVLAIMLPAVFITLALILILRSSAREGQYRQESRSDESLANDAALRTNVRTHFGKKGKR